MLGGFDADSSSLCGAQFLSTRTLCWTAPTDVTLPELGDVPPEGGAGAGAEAKAGAASAKAKPCQQHLVLVRHSASLEHSRNLKSPHGDAVLVLGGGTARHSSRVAVLSIPFIMARRDIPSCCAVDF